MDVLFKTIPSLAKALSGDSFSQQIKLLLKFWYFALSRKLLGLKGDFHISAVSNTTPIDFYLRYIMDLAVLREIYIEKEYDWCPVEDPKVIIDLGAHFGDTALYYHSRFPNAKIIAVEPSPENFERLVKHTKNVLNIIPVQAAVGGSDGTIELSVSDVPFGHSVFSRNSTDAKVLVKEITLATLLAEHNITKADLIKFDIEGAEFSLFNSTSPKEHSQSYIGEVHLDLVPDSSLQQFTESFDSFTSETQKISGNNRYIIRLRS